jgi:hypothetical protein
VIRVLIAALMLVAAGAEAAKVKLPYFRPVGLDLSCAALGSASYASVDPVAGLAGWLGVEASATPPLAGADGASAGSVSRLIYLAGLPASVDSMLVLSPAVTIDSQGALAGAIAPAVQQESVLLAALAEGVGVDKALLVRLVGGLDAVGFASRAAPVVLLADREVATRAYDVPVDTLAAQKVFRQRFDPFDTMVPIVSWHIRPPEVVEPGSYVLFYQSELWKRRVALTQFESMLSAEDYERLASVWLRDLVNLSSRSDMDRRR